MMLEWWRIEDRRTDVILSYMRGKMGLQRYADINP